MTHRRKPKHKQRRKTKPQSVAPVTTDKAAADKSPIEKLPRNRLLDSLRGLAIVLMVIDHAAGILFQQPLSEWNIRFATRLSMPLFCVLMGYFLKQTKPFRWQRVIEVAVACILVNVVFQPFYGKIEILGCLLIAYLLFQALGRYYYPFVLAILFYTIVPDGQWFDFPVTLTVSFVAIGVILRQFGIGPAAACAAAISCGAFAIREFQPSGVNHLLCYFVLPATLLVYAGTKRPNWSVPGLDLIGRYPLTCYVVQYYMVFGIAHFGGSI